MPKAQMGHDTFEIQRDVIDVTSMHRPDPGWAFVDSMGHSHFWVDSKGERARYYRPEEKYAIPSIEWVKDGETYFEDSDEPHEIGHHECKECRATVVPGYTADANKVYMPGLAHCYINGEEVTKEEFDRRFEEAKKKYGQA